MTLTTDFRDDALGFSSRLPIGVDDRQLTAINGLKPAAGNGNHLLLATATYTLDWTMEPFNGEALLTPHVAAIPGRERCIYLPWEPDAAISVDLDNSVDWFFTATLTGCHVRVYPVAGGVRVTHGNGKTAYNNVFAPVSTSVGPSRFQLITADAVGSAAATGHVNGMFGAAMPGEKFVRKANYVGHVSEVHLKAARQRFRTPRGEKLVEFGAAETSGKPESSCFVWGHRHGVHGWQFWYQSTVQISAKLESGIIFKTTRDIYGQSVVLGTPDMFYP